MAESYRKAIKETVAYFSDFQPTTEDIDSLKSEGIWNNDWEASMELLKRFYLNQQKSSELPSHKDLVHVFNNFYFGGDPEGDPFSWKGFILNEPLLVKKSFFKALDLHEIAWGFVSGAERASAKFVLEKRLGLINPPLIAMGEAPDKPDPTGLIHLASHLNQNSLGREGPAVAYLGDTVADILTIKNARETIPEQKFISFGIAPPHLKKSESSALRSSYEAQLKAAGADIILREIIDVQKYMREI